MRELQRRSGRQLLSMTIALACLWTGCAGGGDGQPVGPDQPPEQGFFDSGAIRLSYALDLPTTGQPPYRAVVLGHGSGPITKEDLAGFARRMVDLGVAVLRFDKRGVGDSGGQYTGSVVDLDLLASDLIAGVDFLLEDGRIDPTAIGLLGESQAGWIVPIAATRTSDVAFTVLLSGPTMTIEQCNFWDLAADDTSRSIDDLSQLLAEDFTPVPGDFDPRPFLEQMSVPGLWIYGDRDRIIPARESAALLDELTSTLGKDFDVVRYPNGDHGLRDADSGVGIPWWDDVGSWLGGI